MVWSTSTFGPGAIDMVERARRLLEEAAECVQAAGLDEATAHVVISNTFSRPVGELGKEIGAVSVTLNCIAEAGGYSVDYEEVREMTRIFDPAFTEQARAKHFAKIARGTAG